MNKKYLLLLVGPSGSGKSTVEELLVDKFGSRASKVVSHTTRAPRPEHKEVDGVHYHYVSEQFFHDNEDRFVQSVYWYGTFYGSVIEVVEAADINVIVVEPTGVTQFEDYYKDSDEVTTIPVYLNCSEETQRVRMLKRGDTPEEVEKRMTHDDIRERAKEVDFNLVIDVDHISEKTATDLVATFINGWIS